MLFFLCFVLVFCGPRDESESGAYFCEKYPTSCVSSKLSVCFEESLLEHIKQQVCLSNYSHDVEFTVNAKDIVVLADCEHEESTMDFDYRDQITVFTRPYNPISLQKNGSRIQANVGGCAEQVFRSFDLEEAQQLLKHECPATYRECLEYLSKFSSYQIHYLAQLLTAEAECNLSNPFDLNSDKEYCVTFRLKRVLELITKEFPQQNDEQKSMIQLTFISERLRTVLGSQIDKVCPQDYVECLRFIENTISGTDLSEWLGSYIYCEIKPFKLLNISDENEVSMLWRTVFSAKHQVCEYLSRKTIIMHLSVALEQFPEHQQEKVLKTALNLSPQKFMLHSKCSGNTPEECESQLWHYGMNEFQAEDFMEISLSKNIKT